ncbi:MAG TPA: DUF2637 domain-containing protein [Acidimicrobiales bacterium]|nr:DUF2637 domain-containing protein [Acidimicrobiales bacterium]
MTRAPARPPATAMPAGHRQPLAPATGNTTGLPAGRGRALPAAGHRPTRAVAGHARPAAPAMTAAMTLWLRWLATVAVVLVAGVAAATSYEHQHELLLMVGETGWRARLLPLSVDGLMVAASLCLLVRRNTGKPARLAWLGLVLGGVVSVAANIATAEPTIVGRLVAAWPPIAFALAYELLMQLRTEGDQ